ncbi:sensor domain-containing diguanylate cyclase [Aliivibrio fischeri]|uniref:sensor domain-containing diguanylate cyclase n=1 Tax=Aliivibrio fischeri TaxID=668 RepID=UPI0012D8B76F|nr:sensor domain-containing diguanylate cyclase [Aliivibrio fischeri]MUI53104.1 diguanylate cyclase [Aliivibrio fischeri]
MQYKSFFKNNACAMLICKNDPFSTIVEANDAFYNMVGYTRQSMEQVHKNRFANIVCDELTDILEKVSNAINKGDSLDYEYRICNQQGEILWIHDIATYDPVSDVFYVVIMDITYRQVTLESVSKMANIDSLTGLLNRSHLEEKITQEIELLKLSSSFAMCLIDLDNFKAINDSFGHMIGDHVLSTMGEKLSSLFENNYIIGRLGGDEFAVFLTNIDSIEALSAIAQTIVDSLVCEFRGVVVSASVGVYFDKTGTYDFKSMYEAADKALYCVKNKEKGKFDIQFSSIV